MDRRTFIGASLTAAAAFANQQHTAETMIEVAFEPTANPRLGFIGVGGRGTELLKNFLAADAKINAICDLVPDKAKNAQRLVEQAGQKQPEVYTDGDHAFEKLVTRDDIDLVIIATPWSWHVPMAVAAMTHGKHAATEVPAATTLEDCWQLVNTSEKTRRHCVMLENCCYGENETLVLNMVQAGLFGDLLYGEAAYIHDLRKEMFGDTGEGLWRRAEHTRRDGNLYPTHGLGPVANYMRINRGDRFEYMVSMSSPGKGLNDYRAANIPKDSPKWKEKYISGDMNTSLIKTASGLTVNLQHDVCNPHPYDRLNGIAGTKGVFKDYPPRLYLDPHSSGVEGHGEWDTLDKYKQQYQHPLWARQGEIARKLGGHGGMDFIECYRLLECMRRGLPPDIDVYDAATWSAPTPLSAMSLAHGSAPMQFPDFTRGRWKQRTKPAIAT